MNSKIRELRQKVADIIAEMKAMLDGAEEAKRSFSDEEEIRYADLDSQVDALKAEVKKMEDLEARKSKVAGEINILNQTANAFPDGARAGGDRRIEDEGPEGGFRNLGEYFDCIAKFKSTGRMDVRLQRMQDLQEKREQTMGTGATGGFALPDQFDSTVRQVTPQEAVVRPRATVIPPGNPPDAKLEFPTLDQTSAQNVYGGVVITHTGEGVTMTETTARLREISLEPKEMSAYVVVTQKLLNNWDACTAFVTGQMRRAMNGAEDYDFLRGDGVNKALGVINCAAAVVYGRAGASAVSYADVYNMYARAKMGGSFVWVASQTVIPQLAAMVDAGGHAVWIGGGNLSQGASSAMPGTLFGIPLVFADRLPALGTKGDLSLLDLSYYLIKDGSGPIAASSEHVFFTSNKVVFKIVWNVDGRPWLTEPIGLEGSTSNTVSPFVVLQ